MSPTWYDVLGVDRTATPEEIRAAWRAAIAELDPSDPRFRAQNEAAEVLLDPHRRAAYDAELPTPEQPALPPAPPEPPPEPGEAPERATAEKEAPAAVPPRAGPRVRTWVILVAAAVAAVLVVLTAVVWSRPHVDPAAVSDAQTAAEQAIVPVLSYDYRHLEEDADTARGYLTSSYADDYDQLFAVIEQNAARVKPVVTAEVIASAVVRTGADQVDVLLFVNRPTTNAGTKAPVVSRDQVTVSMVEQDGEWLINRLTTTPPPA